MVRLPFNMRGFIFQKELKAVENRSLSSGAISVHLRY